MYTRCLNHSFPTVDSLQEPEMSNLGGKLQTFTCLTFNCVLVHKIADNTTFSICFSLTMSLLLNAEEGVGLGFHTLMSKDFPTITSDKISSGNRIKTQIFPIQ